MIPTLSTLAGMILSPLANHLWQSTYCACAAGLLALALRHHRAQVRYGLWLIASLKFLVPFSCFVWVVNHWVSQPASIGPHPGLSVVMREIAQPFPAHTAPLPAAPPLPNAPVASVVPTILLMVWISGFMALLFVWWLRWRRVTVALRTGHPLWEGREIEALNHFQSTAGVEGRIDIMSSPALFEPGVYGIWRPVLLLPKGISDYLTDKELEAVIGHEVCHARRRDNLASAAHMVVAAIFWFYPPVWWMGRRLLDERERACDEEVLRLGSKPQIYAESILKVCKHCIESPLPCMAGVSDSNLRKRMERIMNYRVPRKLDFGKKLMLAAVGTALLAVGMAANREFRDQFKGKLEPGWQWVDPLGDSSMSLDARQGFLRIMATGYHDLWPANRKYNAPRLVREVSGDFTLETQVAGDRPCGGLLVWKDESNFVRFERGIHFRNELSFDSNYYGDFRSMARDYAAGESMWLRLTRRGSTITATYSRNGEDWLPLKRRWRLFGFKKQPPQVEDGRSMLAEEDLIFEPGASFTEFAAEDPILVGVDGIVPAVAPPIGLKQTVTDYSYVAISQP